MLHSIESSSEDDPSPEQSSVAEMISGAWLDQMNNQVNTLEKLQKFVNVSPEEEDAISKEASRGDKGENLDTHSKTSRGEMRIQIQKEVFS